MTTDLSGAVWNVARKSQGNGACVQWTRKDGMVYVRDSKNPGGPVLAFRESDEWPAFIDAVKNDDFVEVD
ncbi:MAG: DUF397 domain-containing protein [Micromonosporaceae bacterium]